MRPIHGEARRPDFLANMPMKSVEPANFPGSPPGMNVQAGPLRVTPTTAVMVASGGEVPAVVPPPPGPPPPSRAEVEAKMSAEITARLSAGIELLRATSDRLASDARTDALELGFMVARRIFEREVTSGVEPLVALLRAAVRRLGEARKITVRLHPTDAEAVEGVMAARGAGALVGQGLAQVELVPDPTLARGDCMVDGDLGSVDGRLERRLEELRRAVDAALDEEGT